MLGHSQLGCRADLLVRVEAERGGGEEEKEKRSEARQPRQREGGSPSAIRLVYVIVWVQPEVTGRTARHSTVQYNNTNTTQERERTCEKERGVMKSRHIRSSQVRLQRKKSKPPKNKNAVEGGGRRGQGRVI